MMDLFIISSSGVIPILQCSVVDTVKDPTGICFAGNGDALVTSSEYHFLYVLGNEGVAKQVIGGHGIDQSKFKSPKQVAFYDDTIYIMESIGDRVQMLSAVDYKFKGFFGSGADAIKIPSPSAFCIGPNGYMYVCITSRNKSFIFVYHWNGLLIHQFDTGLTRYMTGIAIDCDGNIHVSSYSGVKVFNFNGDPLYAYCTHQWGATGIAITSSGLCLVTCKGLLAVYTSSGSLVCEYRGQFYPQGVAVAPDGSVWITGQDNIVVLPYLFLPPFPLSLLCHQFILQVVDELPLDLLPPLFNRVFNEWLHEIKIELHSNDAGEAPKTYSVRLKLGLPLPIVHRFLCSKLKISTSCKWYREAVSQNKRLSFKDGTLTHDLHCILITQ